MTRRPLRPISIARAAAVAAVILAMTLILACARDTGGTADSVVQGFGDGSAAAVGNAYAPPPPPVAAPAPSAPYRMREGAEEKVASEALMTAPASADMQATVRQAAQLTQGTQASDPLAGAMLIRTGAAYVEVRALDSAIARVRALAARTGAVVANVSMQSGRNEVPTASLEIRVPSDRFDALVDGLTPLGKVENVNVSVEDVGEEFVDVTARVANAKRLEARLIELLAQRTGRLGDVLAVERELARVREEIERHEGRLRFLRARVAVSRLTITLHEPPPLVAPNPGYSPLREALKQAWRNFVGLVAWFIASLGILVPVGVVIGVAGVVLRRRLPRWLRPGRGPRAGDSEPEPVSA